MLLRAILLAGFAYLLYRVIKWAFGGQYRIDRRKSDGVIDEMVQDPHCKIYVPRREAERRHVNGKEYFFCSKKCAEEFEKQSKP